MTALAASAAAAIVGTAALAQALRRILVVLGFRAIFEFDYVLMAKTVSVFAFRQTALRR